MGGRAGRTDREPGHDGAGRAGVGLATKKKSVHAAGRDPGRVRALRAAYPGAMQTEDFTRFQFVDEMRTAHLGPVPT